MSSVDYIPASDADFLLWVQAFSGGISADPAAFMMTPAQAADIAAKVALFTAALATATFEGTRTKGTIASKDDARSICESLCRQYAVDIKNNVGISDEDKIDIGVRPINPDRERIDPPTTQPLLNIVGGLPGTQTVRYADSATPDSGRRPYGVVSMQLFRGIGDDELPVQQCQFFGNISRNPVDVEFSADDDKKTATYYGRWVTARGEVGPMSMPVSLTIAA